MKYEHPASILLRKLRAPSPEAADAIGPVHGRAPSAVPRPAPKVGRGLLALITPAGYVPAKFKPAPEL